jgi:2',3'-cyclic-nucleotide 2'-phosphodiesterase (5'-nucleotidase family)
MLGLVLLVLAVRVVAAAVPLTLLYTNDLHARLERFGGLAERIAAERATGVPLLLLDAGDAWQDFRVPVLAVWGSEETVAWMNAVGYDAMALGNHELYLGAEVLAQRAGQARFPLLCANLRPCGGVEAPFVPFIVREIGGLRVLLIGLVTGDELPYPDIPWLAYEPPQVALSRALDAAPEADLTVVVAHIPVSGAVDLAEAVAGVDVFVTGHSHSATPAPLRVGRSLVVQAGAFGRLIGRLRLEVDTETGQVDLVDNALLPTTETPAAYGRGFLILFGVAAVLAALVALVLVGQKW